MQAYNGKGKYHCRMNQGDERVKSFAPSRWIPHTSFNMYSAYNVRACHLILGS